MLKYSAHFIDFYVLKKFGLSPFYAEKARIELNWAAASPWIITLLSGLLMNIYLGIEIFFLGLPGWFAASIIYIVVSKLIQSTPTLKLQFHKNIIIKNHIVFSFGRNHYSVAPGFLW